MDRSSSRMEKFAGGARASQPNGSNRGVQNASKSPRSGVRDLAIAQPLIFDLSLKNFCVVFTLATTYFSVVSAQTNFSHPGNSYNCSSNWICKGTAHEYNGSLSLIPETQAEASNTAGLAYSSTQVKLLDLDPSTNRSLSFSTYFAIKIMKGLDNDNISTDHGDGMAFVISGDNSTIGSDGSALGVFNRNSNYTTKGRRIVVEFDTVLNSELPINDINDNHVSLDFTSINTPYAESAYDVSVDLSSSFQAWVEYSNETQLLEVRISNSIKPSEPVLSQKVDLFEVVDEYMWVGFAAGSGGQYCNYYLQNWTFTVAPLTTSGGSPNWGMIVGLSVGVPVFLLASIAFFVVERMYGSRGGYRDLRLAWFRFTKEHPLIQIEGMPKTFEYRELSVACKNFRKESELGEGGFGSVYRGVLPSSAIPVAVKKIKADSDQGEKEFMAEVSIITQLRHRNLIQLLGWCEDASKKQYLLVYELMPNGSLDKVLFGSAKQQTAALSWEKRLNIVTGTAAALDYLHKGCTTQVIHRDIKSSNIMLDEEWNAKLGDFGLARLVDPRREANITDVAGTYGYLAPEVAISNNFSDKSDVFAFGAVVLEVACGRKAWSVHLPPDQRGVVKWVWDSLSKGDLMKTVDQRLEEYDAEKMEVMLTIGLLCSHPDPVYRPSMRSVVQFLTGDAPVPSLPLFMPTLVLSSVPPDQKILSDCSNDLELGSSLESESMAKSLVSNNASHSSEGSTTRFFSKP